MKKKGARKKKEQNKKSLVIVIVAAIVALVAVIAVVIGLNLGLLEKIDDNYFVSDDKKIVLSLSDEMTNFWGGEFEPEITHIVYYYSGDDVNAAKIFFVYDDEKEAKLAYEEIGDEYKEWASKKEVNGKYLVFETDSEAYEGLSAEKLRNDIKSMKAAGGAL